MEKTDGFSVADVARLLGFVLAVNAVGASPAFLFGVDTGWVDDSAWYFPPEVVFPVAWTLLFTLMGVSVFLVYRAGTARRNVRIALAAFGVQMALNVLWTPVFFGLQRPDAGLVVVALLWFTVLAAVFLFDRVDRRASVLLLPYLAWLSFAVFLNYAVYAGL
jgi:tryptophan-rich sensory protein